MRKSEHRNMSESLRSSDMEAEETSESLPLPFQKSSTKERNLTTAGEDGEDGGLGGVSATATKGLLWSTTMTRCSFPEPEEDSMVRLEATAAGIRSMVSRDSVDVGGEEVQEPRRGWLGQFIFSPDSTSSKASLLGFSPYKPRAFEAKPRIMNWGIRGLIARCMCKEAKKTFSNIHIPF